jgi:hypothetical protein
MGAAGGNCLSQKGPAAGMEDVAAHGAITASSTADTAAHGANMAVDGSSSTFWVTGLVSALRCSWFVAGGGLHRRPARWTQQGRSPLPLTLATKRS